MPSSNLNSLSSRLVYAQEDIVHLIKGPNIMQSMGKNIIIVIIVI